MNKYTKTIRPQSPTSRKPQKNSNPWIFKMIIICSVMLGTIFCAFVLRIYLNDRTEKLNRLAEKIKFEMEEKDREILNLKNKREYLCSWENIEKKIKEYNLALRPTEYSQITYMKRYDSIPYDQAYPDPGRETEVAAHENFETPVSAYTIRY